MGRAQIISSRSLSAAALQQKANALKALRSRSLPRVTTTLPAEPDNLSRAVPTKLLLL